MTGILGDLFESYVKRSVVIKDMGTYFPGIGGVFDRLDGLFFGFPIVYYYGYYFLDAEI